jgi:hypothetical protein
VGIIPVWNTPAITWQEFRENFRSYHIPAGLIELKQEEFRALKQGSMSVSEYHDKFAQLSFYALGEVAKDDKNSIASSKDCMMVPNFSLCPTHIPQLPSTCESRYRN